MATFRGKAVVSSADLADKTADCNLQYPNGIGKKKGLVVYEDNGSTYDLVMATGSATTSTWLPINERTDADVTSDTITPV